MIPVTPESYAEKLKVDRKSDGTLDIQTPLVLAPHQTLRTMWYSVSMGFNASGKFTYLHVYINESKSDWRFYDDVTVDEKPIKLYVVKREVTSNSYGVSCEETVSFFLRDENIVKDAIKSRSGIPYRLSGRNGVREDVIPYTILEAIRIVANKNGIAL